MTFSLPASLRSFFNWLFVLVLTGAEPTLVGGGELGLDRDAEVRDALSDISSLAGVDGRSVRDSETILGCLLKEGEGSAAADRGNDTTGAAAASTLAAGTTRKVLGAVLMAGDETTGEAAVLGGSAGNAAALMTLLGATSIVTGAFSTAGVEA
jgi:hypothetical protein